MDEDIDVRKKNVDEGLRDAVTNELTSFTNPQSAPNPNAKSASALRVALEQKIDFGIQNALGSNVPKENGTAKEVMPGMTKPKPAEIPKNTANTKPIIRTYKSDMEETIQAGHLSSLNMAVSENNKMMRQIKQGSLEEKRSSINKKSKEKKVQITDQQWIEINADNAMKTNKIAIKLNSINQDVLLMEKNAELSHSLKIVGLYTLKII